MNIPEPDINVSGNLIQEPFVPNQINVSTSNDSSHSDSINFSNNLSTSPIKALITLSDWCDNPIITNDSVTCICSNETLTINFDDLVSYMPNPQDEIPFNPNDWICYENNTEIACPDPETIDHFKRDIIYLIK
ncbi:MAG: hypothetical protein KAS32_17355 [Candidatus Peribacteraceae bacterium]|nr:hypothetical protein [Candidatus Peribacteraceae bacterium]